MSRTSMVMRLIAFILCVGVVTPSVAGPPTNAPVRGGKEGKVPLYALARQAGLTTLADLLQIAGLQRTLQVEGPLTVFAPTNQAFEDLAAAVGEDVLNMIVTDTELLTKVLMYHVVDPTVGAVPSEVAVTLSSAPMANGEEISINFDGTTLTINDAAVVMPDVLARNGIAHVIDGVLIPPSLLEALSRAQLQASKTPAGITQETSFGDVKASFKN